MTSLIKILGSFFIGLVCYSCNFAFDGIHGEGSVTRKEKSITDSFNEIKVSRGLEVILTGKNDQKIVVEANENLHEHIQVYVENETLIVTADKNIFQADEKTVFVSYKKLHKISATSGASVNSQEPVVQKDLTISATSGANVNVRIRAETLNSSVTSGATIHLSGQVNTHIANATSGSNLSASDLQSLVTEAKGTSGASMKIYAKKEFTGKATSGASVVYYGNPERVSEDDNSGGSVRRD